MKNTGTERRDRTPKGILRRLNEKTIWNCVKCGRHLCTCDNRKEHGIHKDD